MGRPVGRIEPVRQRPESGHSGIPCAVFDSAHELSAGLDDVLRHDGLRSHERRSTGITAATSCAPAPWCGGGGDADCESGSTSRIARHVRRQAGHFDAIGV
jgi:hypothetical protein